MAGLHLFRFFILFCVFVFVVVVFVWFGLWVGVFRFVCSGMWRPEVDVRCLHPSLFTSFVYF